MRVGRYRESIRYSFVRDVFVILLLGTFVISVLIGLHLRSLLKQTLAEKGTSLAANIAKRNENALLISGRVELKGNVLVELVTDEEVAYTVIEDRDGAILTSQFESINYKWPGLAAILPQLSPGHELAEMIGAIKAHAPVLEVSVPIALGVDTVGRVIIGLSEAKIGERTLRTVLFVVGLNVAVALGLGAVLFFTSKRALLDPIVGLSDAAGRLAEGDLATRVDLPARGEIGTLVDSFNRMADGLASSTVSKNYVDNILHSIIDTLIVVSPEREIVLCNPAACTLLGYEEGDLLGSPLETIFHGGREECSRIVDEIQANGFVSNVETSYRTRAGTRVDMLFSGSVILDADRQRGTVCVASDVTELLSLRRELVKLDKLESLGVLAGGLAHDFNNLLQGVFGHISLARVQLEEGGEANRLLERAEQALELSRNLTRQLLTFSKGGEPVKKTVALPAAVEAATRFALSGSNVECSFSFEPGVRQVEADPGQLDQVVQNIVRNAADAMPGGGAVHIAIGNLAHDGVTVPGLPAGDHVQVAISDRGPGIPTEHLPKIFDPYFTTKRKGNGLGLATAFSIVKRHGGVLDVESREGGGTTFRIYLPASDHREATPPAESAAPVAGTGLVLVMDDDPMVRDIAGGMLSKLGYGTESAVNGEEAVQKYAEALAAGSRFDAVILDLTVKGGMGGKEAIAELLALDPALCAIVSSGYSEDPVMADFRRFGFREALAKPFRLADLGQALENAVT